jgi:transposase
MISAWQLIPDEPGRVSMIQVTFTEQEKKAFNYERYHNPDPRVQQKMEVMWLKSNELSTSEIAKLAGVCPNTVRNYLREYAEGRLERLKTMNYYRPESDLESHRTTLEAYFEKNPPATVKEAMSEIEALTGINRSETQVRAFMKKIGLKCRKVGMLPAKADPEEQAAFKAEKLEPRLEEAKAGKRVVFFVDAAHFVLAPFLGFLWSFTRLFVKAPAGRQRFNVLGALNAITHELITVTNDTYINAESFCALLLQLAALSLSVPITLVLDNARYQKCAVVAALAASLHIELLYLPAYSPNLNLIERLWKFVKKECLYSKYYADFAAFKAAIQKCLSETHSTHKTALDSLLTLNFQTFEKAQFVTA